MDKSSITSVDIQTRGISISSKYFIGVSCDASNAPSVEEALKDHLIKTIVGSGPEAGLALGPEAGLVLEIAWSEH